MEALKIHKELFESLETEIIPELKNLPKVETQEKKEKYRDLLSRTGFHSIKSFQDITEKVNEAKKENHKLKIKKRLSEGLEFIQRTMPFNRIISFTSLMRIMKKYDLYLGHSQNFQTEIPPRNLVEFDNFHSNLSKKMDILKKKMSFVRDLEDFRETSDPCFMVSATIEHFNTKNKTIVDRCIFDIAKPKLNWDPSITPSKFSDPIILVPFMLEGVIFFFIVTAWGKEASDEEIANFYNN